METLGIPLDEQYLGQYPRQFQTSEGIWIHIERCIHKRVYTTTRPNGAILKNDLAIVVPETRQPAHDDIIRSAREDYLAKRPFATLPPSIPRGSPKLPRAWLQTRTKRQHQLTLTSGLTSLPRFQRACL